MSKHSESMILLIHGLSGSVSGTLSTFLLYPLENLKTRMQVLHRVESNKKTDEKDPFIKDIEESKKENEETEKQLTLLDLIKKVFKEEGIKGFYKGVAPLCAGSFVSYGVYFSCYEFLKRMLQKHTKMNQNSVGAYVLTSAIAGIVTTIATNAFWVVNTKMTVDKSKKGFKGILKQLLEDEGIKGLFKGLKASLVLVSNPIIQFVIYEQLKKRNTNSNFQSLWNFLFGAISKAIATILTFPYQVIRTNIQLEKDKQFKEIFSLIYKKNGIPGYFRGLTPKLTQTVINSAVMLMIYEKILLMVKTSMDKIK